MTGFDAIVLAGGKSERLGGVDKALVMVGRSTLLNRVVDAVRNASRIVCVGPVRNVTAPVLWTREDPAGGGPVAGLAAGLQDATEPVVVVLAVDMPFATSEVIERLVELSREAGAAAVIDDAGRVQPLLAAYRTDVLRARLRELGTAEGISMMRLLEGMSYVTLMDSEAAIDFDTPADLEFARAKERE